jgi:hypothetical protein
MPYIASSNPAFNLPATCSMPISVYVESTSLCDYNCYKKAIDMPFFDIISYSANNEVIECVAEPIVRVAEPTVRVAEPIVRVAEPTVRVAEVSVCVAEPIVRVAEPIVRVAEVSVLASEVTDRASEVSVRVAEPIVCVAEVTDHASDAQIDSQKQEFIQGINNPLNHKAMTALNELRLAAHIRLKIRASGLIYGISKKRVLY